MVTQYGMSERIGSVKLGSGGGEPFLGRDMGQERNYSDQVAYVVDEEIRRLLDNAHDEAYQILTENRDVLDRLALELLERETLNQAEIAEVFSDVRKRDVREVWLSKPTRPVHSMPPVVSPRERREAKEIGAPDPASVAPQDQIADADLPQDFDVSGNGLPQPESSGQGSHSGRNGTAGGSNEAPDA